MQNNLHLTAIMREPIAMRANGTALEKAARKEMLERVRGGEHVELQVDAVVYIQRDEPNRNFFRFAPKIMKSLARSAVGVPFLMNHDQDNLLSRGGTVIASSARKNDNGEWEIVQTFELVKPWAVEGFLDGTIDRFSIGALPTGPIVYKHNGAPVVSDSQRWPEHFPGDEIKSKGKTVVVEYVATEAEMIETSGVNVPAVKGTGPDGFRAALSALFGGMSPPENSGNAPQEETCMKNIMTRLGLSADASEASALEALDVLTSSVANAEQRTAAVEIELNAERESHNSTRAQLTEFQSADKERKALELNAKIDALYDAGKLAKNRDAKGVEVADAMEATLRETHNACGAEAFDRIAAGLAVKVPIATEKQSDNAIVPKPKLSVSARHSKMLEQMGMSEEEFKTNLEAGGRVPVNFKPVIVGGNV